MSEFPFIYICSHAGKIGNFRWVNSDTRWPDWIHKRWIDSAMRKGYWGRCGLVNPPDLRIVHRRSLRPDQLLTNSKFSPN